MFRTPPKFGKPLTWKQIWEMEKRCSKAAEKQARARLRRLKVTPLPELWAEVLKASARNDGDEIAAAYLLALSRRMAAETLANPYFEDATRRSKARKLVNYQRRIDGIAPLPDVFMGETVPMLAPAPKALPPAAYKPPEPKALPAATDTQTN